MNTQKIELFRTVIDKIATEPRLGEEDRKFMKEYMAKHKEHSRRPFQEGHALRLVMKYHKPHLVLGTAAIVQSFSGMVSLHS